MATTVTNNPYDVTQQKFTGFGDVSGLITGGAMNGTNWDFMDQQGKVLTSVPYQDFVNNYQSQDGTGAVRSGITSVNGVPVYNFNGGSASTSFDPVSMPAATAPVNATTTAPATAPATGIIGGTINNGAKIDNQAAPAAYNPTAGMAIQSFTPQTREVNQATDTTAGQVQSLLANDSPLLQRARTLAMQNMNQRGLVNSSMAQGAGVSAMVDKITPIAAQDAQIYNQRAIDNMDAINQAGQFNVQQNNALISQGMGISANKDLAVAQQNFQSAQAELDRALQASMQDKSIKAQQDLTAAQQNFQSAQAALDRQQQSLLSQSQIASNERLTLAQIDATAKNLSTSNQAQMDQLKLQIENNKTEAGKGYAANLAAQANAQINALLADGNLDAAAKQSAIDNVIKSTNASLQWASTFYNTTLPAYTAPGGTNSSITPATKFSQEQANQALANLRTTDPNATYADVVKAGLAAGYTRAQIDTAYSANNIPTTGIVGGTVAQAPAASAPAPTAPPPAPTPSAPSSTAIKDYVNANLSNPAAISQAAIANGVSVEQIASAVGVSPSEARAYFQNAGVAIP